MNMLKVNMLKVYNDCAYTHNYILGFTDRGNIYFCFCDSDVLNYIVDLGVASGGKGCRLTFKPTIEIKEFLKSFYGAKILCSKEKFELECEKVKYNRGEVFEKLITEYYGKQKWEKDNIPFYEGSDLFVNDTHYQIKFEGATFINEEQYMRLLMKKYLKE